MDNPEVLSALSTQDTGQINVRENRGDHQEGKSRENVNIENTRHRRNKL